MDPQAEIRAKMRERELNGKGRERVKRVDRATGGINSEKNAGTHHRHPRMPHLHLQRSPRISFSRSFPPLTG